MFTLRELSNSRYLQKYAGVYMVGMMRGLENVIASTVKKTFRVGTNCNQIQFYEILTTLSLGFARKIV